PAGLAILDAKQFAVALAGVNEVALVGSDGKVVWRVGVGHRPTVGLPGHAGQPLGGINTFDDSLFLIDIGRRRNTGSIPRGAGPRIRPAGARRTALLRCPVGSRRLVELSQLSQ